MATLMTFIFMVALATVSNAQETLTTGLLGNVASVPFRSMQKLVSAGANMEKDSLDFSLGTTYELTSGVVVAKKALANSASNVASKSLNYATQAGTKAAGMFTDVLPENTFIGTLGKTGGKLIGAAASTANAGGQTVIATGKAAEMAKLDAIKGGVSAGTGLAGTAGKSVIDVKEGLINTGLGMAGNGAATAGSAIENGVNTAKNAAKAVGVFADGVSTLSNKIATGASGYLGRSS